MKKAKARATSTGSISNSLAGTAQPLPQGTAHDTTQSARGASQPPSTPCPSQLTILRAPHSEPNIPTKSTRRRHPTVPHVITYNAADKNLALGLRELDVKGLKKDEKGFNYVFSIHHAAKSGDMFFKVGETKDSIQRRLQRIHSQCGLVVKDITIPGQVPGPYYKKAEKLILAELAPYKHNFECDCGINHKEYFKGVSESHLIAVTWRWTRFCESEPWDAKGKLLPFWEARLNQLEARSLPDIASSEDRAKKWKEFACPSPRAYHWYNSKALFASAITRYQLWIGVFLSLFLNLAMTPSRLLVCFITALQLLTTWTYTVSYADSVSDKSHARPGVSGMLRRHQDSAQDNVPESSNERGLRSQLRGAIAVARNDTETMNVPVELE
ncbi:uncharacterized protein F5Z01DRAFT_624841 [Emericellopsis atlantica]|uniref:Bacteriophage T5 Orf172 DNA-binding domain-containing protein n=1 Tax=Emericellopsis atlantica TaxID=2614577 RepID=A0A9P8CPN1_9HYPO|nr:uncharacterized protein F5Z01DRAFT_624841 [Emericellopsis atlantica]KAG9252916.1 hypothetical protein F5Z01DRAFT_624841 [Emericellopsis atlantica]